MLAPQFTIQCRFGVHWVSIGLHWVSYFHVFQVWVTFLISSLIALYLLKKVQCQLNFSRPELLESFSDVSVDSDLCDSITGSDKNYEPINSEQFRGCPVCRIGQEFAGGAHRCNICKKFIHPWYGISEEERSGKGITCKNCS